MVTICAWCQRYLGTKEPVADPSLTHGICKMCALRQQFADDVPTLVVSRERAGTVPFLQGLLHGMPEIRVIIDRREGDRRRSRLAEQVREQSDRERRLANDRRQSLGLVLV